MTQQTNDIAYAVHRAHDRVPVACRVRLMAQGQQRFELATDISEGGLGLDSTARLAEGTRVTVRLEVLKEGEMELTARVVWCNERAMGLRFEHLDARTADAIHRLRTDLHRC
jgi:hypothetical protein